MENTTNQEMMDDILAIFSAFIAEYFDGIDPFQIELETKIQDLTDDIGKMELVKDEIYTFYKVEKPEISLHTVGELVDDIAAKLRA